MGIIDSISEGLALVRRRPRIMLIPLIVDLGLWLAPRLSVQPLVARLAESVGLPATMSGPEAYDTVDLLRQFLLSFGEGSNLLSLIGSGLVGIPSLVGAGVPSGLAHPGGQVALSNLFLAAVVALILSVVGLLVAAVYLTVVASAVRGEAPAPRDVLAKAWRNGVRLLVLVGVLIAVGLALGIPATVVVTVVSLLSPTVAALTMSLLGLLALWAVLWVLFYLFFVVDAMVLQEIGLQRAILNSVIVVRSSFWRTLGLVILLNVLTAGFTLVWEWVAVSVPLGILVAIAGNTFIGSGLVAASFVYYRDRYEVIRARLAAS